MTALHRRGAQASAAVVLGIAFVTLAAACGQSGPSATGSTPSAAPARPAGGPVPAQLIGDWFLPPATVAAIMGNPACNSLKLTLAATTYHLTHASDPACGTSSSGDVVVNNTEIDFFNADACGLKLPDGVGRYRWALSNGVLQFTPLGSDPCPRGTYWLANRSYSHTS